MPPCIGSIRRSHPTESEEEESVQTRGLHYFSILYSHGLFVQYIEHGVYMMCTAPSWPLLAEKQSAKYPNVVGCKASREPTNES